MYIHVDADVEVEVIAEDVGEPLGLLAAVARVPHGRCRVPRSLSPAGAARHPPSRLVALAA